MQEFKVFRAIGLGIKSWIRNFIPFTVLMAILYAPAVLWIMKTDPNAATSIDDLQRNSFIYPIMLISAAATLLPPMLIYRVVQELNGTKVSILTSMKYGVRGILPALIIAAITFVVGLVPLGGIINIVLTCVFFVATPAAVAERLNPFKALSRSAELTGGRRWGIFGLTFLIGLVQIAIIMAVVAPMLTKGGDEILKNLKSTSLICVIVIGVFQMFDGVVQAISYALLRADKDGMSHEQLAKVFE